MRVYVERINFFPLLWWLALLAIPTNLWAGDLIAPTRSLDGAREVQGKLSVTSEPPGLEVLLDGSKIGPTPVWQQAVKPGTHKLQIGNFPAEVTVGSGEMKTLSLFRGSLIELPAKSEAVGTTPEAQPHAPKRPKSPEEAMPRDLTPWERFLNGTSRSF